MTDETIRFDPPVSLHDLVAQAGEEEWAIAATTMFARMLREVARGVAPVPWIASLKVFGLAEELPVCAGSARGYMPCRLTAAGEKAARDVMVIT